MNVRRLTARGVPQYLAIGLLSVSALQVSAEEIPVVQVNGDTPINLWVDRAPLGLFIAELATTIGLESVTEAPLEGQISGRFNGKLNDTLATVGEQHSLLFDVDERVLGVMPESARSNSSVLVDVDLDDSVTLALLDNLLPGNTVDLHEDMVTISGHPSFVKRVARFVIAEVSLAEKAESEFTLDLALDADVQEDIPVADVQEDALVADVDTEVNVIDLAAQVMLADPTEPSLELQQDQSASRKIEWVTDIPGFNTF